VAISLFLSPTPLVIERDTVPIGQLLLVGEHHPRTVQDTIGVVVVLNALQKRLTAFFWFVGNDRQ
jgi:hypothetical protein